MSKHHGTRRGAVLALAALLAGGGMAPLAAQAPTPQREHTVRRGDTLWDLARTYFSNPFLWPVIFEANRSTIANPHWIYPAERIVIPGLYGGPGDPQQGAFGAGWDRPEGSIFDRPRAGQDPAQSAAELAAHTLVRPAEYRATPWLADTLALHSLGRLAALVDPADRGTRLPTTLRPFDRVFLSLAGATAGDSLLVARLGRAVGAGTRIVQPLGVVRVDSVIGASVAATLLRQFGDARIGDVLLPLDAVPALPSELAAAGAALSGVLMTFLEEHAIYGMADYGFLDIGRRHGLAIGDELAVYMPVTVDAATAAAPQIATVRVIRVEDATATVRVTGVTTTTLAPGLPVRLVRRAS